MASSSGIATRSSVKAFSNDVVVNDGTVQVAGEDVNLATVAGAHKLKQAVTAEEYSQILAMLTLKEVTGEDGTFLVANDQYGKVDAAAKLRAAGPTSTSSGQSDLDQELGKWFVSQTGINPCNANTTEALYQKIGGSAAFLQAVGGANTMFANPTAANQEKFIEYMQNLQASNPHGNIMEVLYLVFRESIRETNEDKKYFLIKLQQCNKMAEALSDYLKYLIGVSRELGASAAGADYPEMVLTAEPVKEMEFDLTTLDANGDVASESVKHEEQQLVGYKHMVREETIDPETGEKKVAYKEVVSQQEWMNTGNGEDGGSSQGTPVYQTTMVEGRRLDRMGLSNTIKEVESMQETVRNKREMTSTAFQNFDQKSNQLFNLMASVLKTMNEMRSGTVRNML